MIQQQLNLNQEVLQRAVQKVLGHQVCFIISHTPIAMTELSRKEKNVFARLKSAVRRHHWLLGRKALKALLADFGEPQDTSVLSFPSPRFSLTHSGECAIAAGTHERFSGLGIDLEIGRSPSLGSMRFFLTGEEIQWVLRLDESLRKKNLLRLWTIKEALFKANPRNSGTSLRQYELLFPGDSCGTACISSKGQFHYAGFEVVKGGFFAVAVEEHHIKN